MLSRRAAVGALHGRLYEGISRQNAVVIRFHLRKKLHPVGRLSTPLSFTGCLAVRPLI